MHLLVHYLLGATAGYIHKRARCVNVKCTYSLWECPFHGHKIRDAVEEEKRARREGEKERFSKYRSTIRSLVLTHLIHVSVQSGALSGCTE